MNRSSATFDPKTGELWWTYSDGLTICKSRDDIEALAHVFESGRYQFRPVAERCWKAIAAYDAHHRRAA